MNPRDWANHIVAGLSPQARAALAADPTSAVREHFGLRVIASDLLGERGQRGWCDGLSFLEQGDILYAPTPWSDRQNFTILHELGHHLVNMETDEDILVWVADQPPATIEQACDLVAAELLVPATLVDDLLDGGRPTGASVLELHDRTHASREVCAVAIARHLGCEGFVALAQSGIITFASRVADTRPAPWRGDPIPSAHPLSRLANGQSRAVETYWPRNVGNPRRYYMNATRHDGWTYAVFTENDLWDTVAFHAPDPQQLRRPTPDGHQVRCSCGYTGISRLCPCNTCRTTPCPKCGQCECDRREARTKRAMCAHCMRSFPVQQLANGLCDDCR